MFSVKQKRDISDKYKFDIGAIVVPYGCTSGYQARNKMLVIDRHVKLQEIRICGEIETVESNIYKTILGDYPENTIELFCF